MVSQKTGNILVCATLQLVHHVAEAAQAVQSGIK